MGKKEIFSTGDIVLIGFFVALITVCSFIRIPFGIMPFTLQTFGVFVTAGILGAKRGTVAASVYIVLGAIGAPVFGGNGGPMALAGPTGGYIFGFAFSAFIIGMAYKMAKGKRVYFRYLLIFIGMMIGETVCVAIGTIQFMAVSDVGLYVALSSCVLPFIISDIIKIVISILFVESVKKALGGRI